MKKIMLMTLSIALVSCGSDGSGSGNSNAVSGALDTASTKIGRVVPDTSSVSFTSLDAKAAITSAWTDSNYSLNSPDIGGTSPKEFIRRQGDSSKQSSLMYRLKQNLNNLCLFTAALPSSSGDITLTSGAEITLTAAVKNTLSSKCNVSLSSLPADGTKIGYKVEDISSNSGTNYDRKVSFALGGGTGYDDFFYYRISGTLTRFSYEEDGTNDSYVYFDYDTSTGIGRYEFSEIAGSFTAHYRVFLDENANEGLFLAYVKQGSNFSKAVVKASEGGGTQLAVSYTVDSTSDITDGNACISNSDFSIASDNTLTCSGITGVASSSWTSTLTGIAGTYVTDQDETTIVQFDSMTNVLTAAPAN
jgi:hypothetical protein